MPWWFGLLVFLFSASSPALAAFSFQILSLEPTSISDAQQELLVNLSLSDLPNPSYFRVAIQKNSGDPYFGYMRNNSGSWVEIKSLGSDCHDYFRVSDTATTSAILALKVGEGYHEAGTYQVKAHRFTDSSCTATESLNSQSLSLNLPTPIPTSTPIPAPTSVPSPTSMPSSTPVPIPTKTPTPSKTPTPKPIMPTRSPDTTPLLSELDLGDDPLAPPDTLGAQVEISSPPTSKTSPPMPPWPAVVLMATGLAGILGSIAFFFFKRSRPDNPE